MQTHETEGPERFKRPSLGEIMTQQDPSNTLTEPQWISPLTSA